MNSPRRFRFLAIFLLILALFLLFRHRLVGPAEGDVGAAWMGFPKVFGEGESGSTALPTSIGSRDHRGGLTPDEQGTSSFNAYLEQYRTLTSSTTRRFLLDEMIVNHGRMFGAPILELIKSFEPPSEARILLLRLGVLHASGDREIHAYALQQFPSGKDRYSLIGAALSHFPVEEIGPFLASMESSALEGDLKETARLIADEHRLGRPQIDDEQLQKLIDGVRSPELRAALLNEVSERPKRGMPAPTADGAE